MKRVDFFISSPGHHVDSALPVAARLARAGVCRNRFLSLCELRGLATPRARLEGAGFPVATLLPGGLRRSPAGGRPRRGRGARLLRAAARDAAWRLALAPRLRRTLREPPALAVLPNDGAWPFDRIATSLRRRRISFLLLQEGVRFELPEAGDPGHFRYGRGGAAAIAAWGESSADYFRDRGVPDERIHRVGCPRFDELLARDWGAAGEEAARRLALGRRRLLLVTNPIDDLGLATAAEKLELVRRFVRGLAPLFDDPELTLAVKLHRRESEADYRAALAGAAAGGRLRILTDEPLHPLLAAAGAVVTIASTAGLEALLLGRPLGVLEIPARGFVHDFVAGGAAAGLTCGNELPRRVADLMARPDARRAAVEAYLRRTLAVRAGAAERTAALIERLLDATPHARSGTGGC